jgi:hypothetical protein
MHVWLSWIGQPQGSDCLRVPCLCRRLPLSHNTTHDTSIARGSMQNSKVAPMIAAAMLSTLPYAAVFSQLMCMITLTPDLRAWGMLVGPLGTLMSPWLAC